MKRSKLSIKNSVPFLLLAVVHVLPFVVFTIRCRQRKIWLLLLSNIGFAYLFEYFVLNLFKGYSYKPKILKIGAHDKVLGAILSQAFYVPITATLLTIYQKNRYWKLGITLIYYLIEHSFLRMRIYKAYWWKPSFTVFFMNIYFYISDWFHKALRGEKRWALVLAQYLSTQVIGVTLLYISAVGRKVRFGRGFNHSWGEHFIIAPLYSIIRVIFLVRNSSKPGLLPRLTIFIGSMGADMLLERSGMLKLSMNKLWNAVFHAFMVSISRFLYLKIHNKQ